MSINSISISGGLKADPEVRHFESGNVLASFTLATETYNNGKKDTTWTDCRVWGKAAEVIRDYCKKGSKICIYNGRLKQEKWTDKTTQQPRTKHVVEGNYVELIDGRPQGQDSDTQQRPPAPSAQPVPAYSNAQAYGRPADQGEMPF